MARNEGIERALTQLSARTSAARQAARSVGELVEEARAAVRAVHRLAERAESVLDEVEPPLRALAPGLRRLAAVLDDPAVQQVPGTLQQVQDDLLPVLRTVADTHERVAYIAGSTERILGFMDEASRTFAGLPGAALLGRRRPAAAPPAGATELERPAGG